MNSPQENKSSSKNDWFFYTLPITKWHWKPWLALNLRSASYSNSWLRWGRWQWHLTLVGLCHHHYNPYSYSSTEKKAFCRYCHKVQITKQDLKPVKGVFLNG